MISKTITVIILTTLFVVTFKAQNNTKTESDEDDSDTTVRHVNRVVSTKIDTEFDINKDKGFGSYKEFYSNKKLSLEGTYKDYKQVGLWKYYFETGIISSKEYYNSAGEKDSIFSYNEGGKLTGEYRWKNNQKNGVWREYSSLGAIQKTETYKNGIFNGTRINYDNGIKYIESTYKEGTLDGLWKEYHTNGKPRITGNYKAGQKNGEWKKFDEDGKVIDSEIYSNGEIKE